MPLGWPNGASSYTGTQPAAQTVSTADPQPFRVEEAAQKPSLSPTQAANHVQAAAAPHTRACVFLLRAGQQLGPGHAGGVAADEAARARVGHGLSDRLTRQGPSCLLLCNQGEDPHSPSPVPAVHQMPPCLDHRDTVMTLVQAHCLTQPLTQWLISNRAGQSANPDPSSHTTFSCT